MGRGMEWGKSYVETVSRLNTQENGGKSKM